jgi:hypothetical protein
VSLKSTQPRACRSLRKKPRNCAGRSKQPPKDEAEAAESAETAVEPVSAPVAPEPAPLTPEAKEEVENLLRKAHLAKMRGQSRDHLDLLAQAEKLAPDFPAVLEALGDGLAEKSRWKDAQAVYGRAMALDKANVGLERKYAQAVLKASIPVEAMLMGSRTGSMAEDTANAKIAAVWSLFFPGVGQMVLGETWKGIGFLGTWLGAWIIALLIPNGLKGIISMAGTKSGGDQPNMIVLLPLFVAIVAWLLAVADANFRAKRVVKKGIERPTPPVDLPFE